jgi:hypothetical protein
MAAFYSADQERARAVERQRQAASKARQTRWPKKPEAAERGRALAASRHGTVLKHVKMTSANPTDDPDGSLGHPGEI